MHTYTNDKRMVLEAPESKVMIIVTTNSLAFDIRCQTDLFNNEVNA